MDFFRKEKINKYHALSISRVLVLLTLSVFTFLFISAQTISGKEKITYDMKELNIVDTTIQLYTYEEMVEDINELTSKYTGILTSETIGQSIMGRDIYAVTLGPENAKEHVMVQASIHGREYINTQVVMKLLEYYAHYYDKLSHDSKTYREIFENTAFHVVPMANPDGVTISQFGAYEAFDGRLLKSIYRLYLKDADFITQKIDKNGNIMWVGKNKVAPSNKIKFGGYQKRWKANARGVDLNRNFAAAWSDVERKNGPSYSGFKGFVPVSEPETKALVNYAIKYDFKYYVNYHSKGQVVYYDCAGNSPELSELEKELAKKVSSYLGYRMINTTKSKDVDFGGFGDWVQLELNKPSLTIETGFAACPVPIKEFNSIWKGQRELWVKLASEN